MAPDQEVMDSEVETLPDEVQAPGDQKTGEQGELTVTPEDKEDESSKDGEPAAKTDEEAASEEEKKRPPKGVQKRLDELTREREDWKRESQYWRQQTERTQQGEPPQAATGKQGVATDENKPKVESYESYDDYVEALTDWKAAKVSRETFQAQASEAADRDARFRAQENFHVKATEARQKYTDFDEVVTTAQAPCTESMFHAILNCGSGAEVMYHLGKNPQESARIAGLSAMGQIMEIGRIEERLRASAHTPPKPPGAPPPINPLKGGGGSDNKNPDTMSYNEYKAWRRGKGK